MIRAVRVNNDPLRNVLSDIRRGLIAGGDPNEVRGMLRKWGTRYLGEMERRYAKFSRGGGDWPALKPSTVRTRRRGGKKRGGVNKPKVNTRRTGGKVAILRDTNTLFAAMRRGNPGNVFKDIYRGITVGVGPTRHPGGKATIADIAGFHNRGAGHLPRRRIFVQPSSATRRGMLRDAQTAYQRMFNRHAIEGGVR